MTSGVAGIAVADAGVGAITSAVEAHPVMRRTTFDSLDVAGDFTQHATAPRDLGPVHSTLSDTEKTGVGSVKADKLGRSIPHRQTFLSTWTALICREKPEGELRGRVEAQHMRESEFARIFFTQNRKIFAIDTTPMTSYCIVPSTLQGVEESRSPSGVLVIDRQRPGRCALCRSQGDQPS